MKTAHRLSDAATRRDSVIDAAIAVFATSGYAATPVAAVAAKAGISQAYVFKLYPTKEGLFVAALEQCHERILARLEASADAAKDRSPAGILDAMGEGYARLIADKNLLMLQVQAQAACDVASIGATVRRGLAKAVLCAKTKSGADDKQVQQFMAFGQLCHLIVTTGLTELDDDWAKTLSDGVRHFD